MAVCYSFLLFIIAGTLIPFARRWCEKAALCRSDRHRAPSPNPGGIRGTEFGGLCERTHTSPEARGLERDTVWTAEIREQGTMRGGRFGLPRSPFIITVER